MLGSHGCCGKNPGTETGGEKGEGSSSERKGKREVKTLGAMLFD